MTGLFNDDDHYERRRRQRCRKEKERKEAEMVLSRAREEAERIIAEAKTQAEQLLEEKKEEARQAAQGVLAEAREEAARLLGGEQEKYVASDENVAHVEKGHHDTTHSHGASHESNYPLREGLGDTLIISCSDRRFQRAFHMFTEEELGLGDDYDQLVFPGASQLLAFGKSLPKFTNALIRPISFLVEGHELKRVVVFMHEDCSWYRNFVPKFLPLKGLGKEQQIIDMVTTDHMLREMFPDIQVDMFYASITPDGHVAFSEIKESKR